jgi:hypothetical protein
MRLRRSPHFRRTTCFRPSDDVSRSGSLRMTRIVAAVWSALVGAVARPHFGGVATEADRDLFAYDVNAPLNLRKAVES